MNTLLWRILSSYKVNKLRTQLHAMLHPCIDPRFVFIFGCQRSGTTMLRNFIGFDPRISDHGEGDPPYFWQQETTDPRYLRVVPDDEIRHLALAQKSPIVLIKPLHDSQRAAEMLTRFPDSRGIWIFRHYNEVILSHLTYYKHRYEPLAYVKDLLDLNELSWKAEGLCEEMRDFISRHRHLAVTPTSAFALFWLARNSLLFKNEHEHMLTLNYKDLVERPLEALGKLSQHIGLELDDRYALFPQQRTRTQMLPEELPEVLRLACEEMFQRLLSRAAVHLPI
jgi:hypothetical protein